MEMVSQEKLLVAVLLSGGWLTGCLDRGVEGSLGSDVICLMFHAGSVLGGVLISFVNLAR